MSYVNQFDAVQFCVRSKYLSFHTLFLMLVCRSRRSSSAIYSAEIFINCILHLMLSYNSELTLRVESLMINANVFCKHPGKNSTL